MTKGIRIGCQVFYGQSFFEQYNPITNLGNMIYIMAGNQKSSSTIFCLLFDNILKANLGAGVEVGKRLIQNHTFRIAYKKMTSNIDW